MGFASFTILVWDHVLTFSDEVITLGGNASVALTEVLAGGVHLERKERPQYAFTVLPFHDSQPSCSRLLVHFRALILYHVTSAYLGVRIDTSRRWAS